MGHLQQQQQQHYERPRCSPTGGNFRIESDVVTKIHIELEDRKARPVEKMIPIHQKRMMFAAQRKLEREKKLERDAVRRHRAELDLKAAEARRKVDFDIDKESLCVDIERRASDFEALDQYEISLERERKSLGQSDAARRAAIEAADCKRKSAHQPSSRPGSPVRMPDNGGASSKVTDYNGHGNELNGVDLAPIETQSRIEHGDAEARLAKLATRRGENRSRRRYGSLDGTMSPGLAEERRRHARETPRRADRSSWPGATTPPHALRTLEGYDDQMYWSGSVEDHLRDPDKASLSQAEELAEELYRDAMEMHRRLVADGLPGEMHALSIAATGISGKGHIINLMPETKETCGDVMYADSCDQSTTGRSSPVLVTPLLIPAEDSESRSVSFSQTSQSSDDPGSQTERAHLEASALNFTRSAGSNEEAKGNCCRIANFEIQESMRALRESNVRKQAKIDSLQKWRAYYQAQLEEKDRALERIEKEDAKERKWTEKAIRKMEKAHAKDVAHRDAKHEAREEKLRSDVKELNLVIEELSGQLYDMEEHLAAGGIPYKPPMNENAGPSSKTLLSAVIGVKEAVHTFSRTFMSYLKQHVTKARDLDEQICLESEVIVARPSDYKFLVQSFILRRMFLDFDSECFNIESCMTEIFDAEEHSRACFQEYVAHRNVSDSVTLLTDNRPHSAFLREFCFKKFLHIVSESTEEAFFGDFNHSDDICAGRHPASRFYESYCRLAVSVWVLHRLAFSFQPPARMIPVRKGAQFNPAYMESAVPGIFSGGLGDDDINGADLPFEALVGLMVHPGLPNVMDHAGSVLRLLRGWPFREPTKELIEFVQNLEGLQASQAGCNFKSRTPVPV